MISLSKQPRETDTKALLQHFKNNGHKASSRFSSNLNTNMSELAATQIHKSKGEIKANPPTTLRNEFETEKAEPLRGLFSFFGSIAVGSVLFSSDFFYFLQFINKAHDSTTTKKHIT